MSSTTSPAWPITEWGAVISTGTDPTDFALGLQRDQQAGKVGGARYLFAAGAAPPGGGPNGGFLSVIKSSGRPTIYDLPNETEARKVAEQLAAKGVTFIKIWVDDRNGGQPKLQPNVYGAFIDEAHKHNVKVLAHPQNARDSKDLLKAGIDGLLHLRVGAELDDEAVRLMKARNVFVTPTLGLGEMRTERVFEDPFLLETITADVATRLRQAFEQRPARPPNAGGAAVDRQRPMREAFAKLIAADIHITLGTDSGGLPDHFFGWADHKELEVFVRLGMTPAQAIVAATSRSAEHAGLGRLGDDGGWEDRRFHRARCKSSGRHQEHPADLEGVPRREGDGPCRLACGLDQPTSTPEPVNRSSQPGRTQSCYLLP